MGIHGRIYSSILNGVENVYGLEVHTLLDQVCSNYAEFYSDFEKLAAKVGIEFASLIGEVEALKHEFSYAEGKILFLVKELTAIAKLVHQTAPETGVNANFIQRDVGQIMQEEKN